MSTANNRILGLDILRTIAILSIVFFHYEGNIFSSTIYPTIKNNLWFGVDLFFVLSGYLISTHWFNKLKANQHSYREFWLKRFFRILPNYYLVLVILITIQLLKKQSFPFWQYFIFIQNFSDIKFFVPSWSLCVEEHFYLIFPFLSYVVVKKIPNKALFFFMMMPFISTIVRFFLFQNFGIPSNQLELEKIYYYPTYARLDGLFLGVLIGYIENFQLSLNQVLRENKKIILLFGTVLFSLANIVNTNRFQMNAQVFGYLMLGLSFSCFLIVLRDFDQKIFFRKFFELTAKYSYFMYLTHHLLQFLIYVLMTKAKLVLNPYVHLSIYLLGLYIISEINYRYYENPIFLSWKKFNR